MVIVESDIFTKLIKSLMSDDEYRQLQEVLIRHPDMGAVIKDSGGMRKVRWKLEGRGKSGGIRAIYYWMDSKGKIFMVYAYPKAKAENLTAQQLAVLKKMVKRWRDE